MRGRVLTVLFLALVLAVVVGATMSYCSAPRVRLGGEVIAAAIGPAARS